MFNFSTQVKNELWWLIISVDYHYTRIAIADYEFTASHLILWLEDKQDYKNTLDECLQLQIPLRAFARLIKDEHFNTYESIVMHPEKKFLYPAKVEINRPMIWYNHDATPTEQRWVREAILKKILTHLVETETFCGTLYAV